MQNLVPGGARRGLFQTRHPRLVHITESFTFYAPPQPGMEPEPRRCWRGTLFQSDGKTPDTNGVWEDSGATQNANGVIQRTDLVILVREDPPEPQTETMREIAAGAPESVTVTRSEAQAFETALDNLKQENAGLRLQLEAAKQANEALTAQLESAKAENATTSAPAA